jgi:hypothetical protein
VSYWDVITLRNPQLNDKSVKIHLTVAELRRIVDRAENHGKKAAEAAAESEGLLDDVFTRIFGKGRRR